MFTPYERRQLRMIEEWFETDDPALASQLRKGPVRRPSKLLRAAVIVLACLLLGLGFVTGSFVLIFAGVVATAVAVGIFVHHR